MDLKDIYFEINKEYGNRQDLCGETHKIEEEIDSLLAKVPNLEERALLDIQIGRLAFASEYKGFRLGRISNRRYREKQIAENILNRTIPAGKTKHQKKERCNDEYTENA